MALQCGSILLTHILMYKCPVLSPFFIIIRNTIVIIIKIIMFTNVKMSTSVDILTFVGLINTHNLSVKAVKSLYCSVFLVINN